MPAFWGYPPPPHDYAYYWVILDPKSKEDKVKVTNLKNVPKLHCLIRCANMKWIRRVLLKIQSRHDSVHRRTDRQMDKVKPVYPPFNFIEAGGINMHQRLYSQKTPHTLPSRASYGMYFVRIWEKFTIITAPYCISIPNCWNPTVFIPQTALPV